MVGELPPPGHVDHLSSSLQNFLQGQLEVLLAATLADGVNRKMLQQYDGVLNDVYFPRLSKQLLAFSPSE
eukprot:CAMPEP_0202903334 /NCGR_PEP_ID=MMETSP1392-20130828/23909_1 /ASSEMBLY_ACC=CAM_ASM_000868 /TAXON_ID=225041 /ORGANISM="Chlamydomonas chlamydogama, Strain SAG 11-48b" /LENGTH=69 /DNA_ID=CAMNT_0049590463 /DNA_START=39 /DNA_END=249 /DNA_ORIENTATION=+